MTNKVKIIIRNALDILALALANEGHYWTQEERSAYEKAIKSIY